jgi:cytochrome c
MMLNLTLGATGAQLIFGPLLFLTLPSKGVSWSLFFVIVGGVVFALAALVLMWRMQVSGNMAINRRFMLIVASLTVTVGFMGPASYLPGECFENAQRADGGPDQNTSEAAKKARENLPLPKETQELLSTINPGQELFQSHCAVCHAAATRWLAPQ